eukprot:scaffold9607_cov24-Prasinocladus_malaysianus.AAC.1
MSNARGTCCQPYMPMQHFHTFLEAKAVANTSKSEPEMSGCILTSCATWEALGVSSRGAWSQVNNGHSLCPLASEASCGFHFDQRCTCRCR